MYTFLQKNSVFFAGLLLLVALVAVAAFSEHSHDDGATRPLTPAPPGVTSPIPLPQPAPTVIPRVHREDDE